MRSHFPSHLSNVGTFILFWTFLFASRAEAQDPAYSFSLDKARQRKTLITKVKMVPSTIKFQKVDVTIGDAWLERYADGGCYLCLQIDKGKESLWNFWLVVEDERSACAVHYGISRNWVQVARYLESPDLSKLRFSLIGDCNETRLKNIRFVPIK